MDLEQPQVNDMDNEKSDFLMGKKPPEYPPFPKVKFKKVPVLKYEAE